MSSSSTAQTTSTTTQDQRQAVQGGQAINAGGGTVQTVSTGKQATSGNGVSVASGTGPITLTVTSGAAFDLAQHTVDTLAGALNQTQINAQGATAALSSKLIQIGIPAAVLIYWIGRK